MSEPTESQSSRRCPQCGSRVKRVLRSANDKRRWDADEWRRYRCRGETCSWQGLLQVSGGRRIRARDERGTSVLVRMGRTALMLLTAGGVTWGCLQALQFLTDG